MAIEPAVTKQGGDEHDALSPDQRFDRYSHRFDSAFVLGELLLTADRYQRTNQTGTKQRTINARSTQALKP